MKTKPIYGNCLFGALFLCIRGRAKSFGLISSHSIWIPAHVVVQTKKGNYIHFRYIFPQNPLYFIGRFEGVRKSHVEALMARENRRLLVECSPKVFLFLGILTIVILTIPWAIFWVVEPLWRLFNGILYVVKRRMRRLANYYFSNNSRI